MGEKESKLFIHVEDAKNQKGENEISTPYKYALCPPEDYDDEDEVDEEDEDYNEYGGPDEDDRGDEAAEWGGMSNGY